MENIERKIKENQTRNKKFIKEFEEWLKEKSLSDKTIKKHISNVDIFINDYLNYYDIETAEEGINSVYSFLSGWFIEKCMWATPYTTKEEAASIKKFYAYMSEKGYVEKEDYKFLCEELKDSMDEILDTLEAFDNGTYYDMF
ncbi:MAG: phage integrase SAM-like domain-containing protein [Bacilli bacterium]|nr:phage integrase SAM-like domain-containing protein [Bacilli bacterium]